MTTAGYSGTPLARKLGVKDGQRCYVEGAPGGYHDAVPATWLDEPTDLDFAHLFCPDTATLQARFGPLRDALRPAGMLWVSWIKKAAKIPTDLDEAGVRAHGLDGGLVDVKICAVDDVWSGLKFVRRLKDR